MVDCCVFDLDGTLLQTLDTITYHLNNTLSSVGLSTITVDDTSAFIGNGARLLVSRAVRVSGDVDESKIEYVLKTYNTAYNSDPLPLTYPYPGVVELIDVLVESGARLSVVTNKPERTAKQLIDRFFPGKFSYVYGGRDGAVLKPDPTDTLDVISKMGAKPERTAFIGDTAVDIETGKNAGVAAYIGVSWGFRDKSELLSAGANLVVDTANELFRELDKL